MSGEGDEAERLQVLEQYRKKVGDGVGLYYPLPNCQLVPGLFLVGGTLAQGSPDALSKD